ncbi:hypothetical protein [Archangium lansingense]|uniref:Outer membrane efflux protein n=1 Tax=Archangium lansingense TaxID=2995310 RepID=A0ABT4ASD6_9BACT|nr:hypothetical protein [Archangium lansinium]MCY1083769.1 hypothetical protein [Archangium lansinium]
MKPSRLTLPLAAAVVLLAGSARAQFVDPGANALQLQILMENVRQTLSMGDQLAQLQQTVTTARENLALVRSVYAGVSEFTSYKPEDLLKEGRRAFLSANPELADALSLGQDLTRPLGEGGLRPALNVNLGVDAYGDAARRREAAGAGPAPAYDARAAWSVSREVQGLLDDASVQSSLARPLPVATAAEGLFQLDMARADAGLAELYMRRQASALSAQEAALAVFKESTTAAPGKAQQLAAQSGAMTAVGVARLQELEAKQLSLLELQRQEEATTRAAVQQERDAAWERLGSSMKESFRRAAPREVDFPTGGPR